MSPQQYKQNGVRVPYIAPWSSETATVAPIVRRNCLGIGYADEDPAVDRRGGVLWVRVPLARGLGCANLGGVHALRQRQAISHMLCQVCGGSTYDRPDERHLFLMRGDQPISEGEKTTAPPIHESCATESMRACPHLREGAVAALVGHAPSWGIAGVVYEEETVRPLPCASSDPLTLVSHDDALIRWTLAAREVITLQDCTPVSLDDLAASAAA